MAEKSLRQQFTDMKVGEVLTVSVRDYGYTTIRSYASEMGFALDRIYRTHRNRTAKTYTVTRVA